MKTKLHFVFFLACLWAGLLGAQDLRQRIDMPPGAKCHDMVRLPGGTTIIVGEMTGTPIPLGWISMLSETGEILWTKIPFDQNLGSQFYRVLPDTDSTVMIGGTKFTDLDKGTDLLLMRMTNKGEIMWSRTVDFHLVDVFNDMDVFQKGAVLVGTTLDDATGLDVVVAILDMDGTPGILRQFGAAGLESATGIRSAGPHGFYICGTTTSYTFPGLPPSGFIMQITPTCSFSWMRLFGGADEQRVHGMALGDQGYPLVIAHEAGTAAAHYICQFNHTGGLEWSKSYTTQELKAITRSPGGKIFVADNNTVFGLDKDGQVVSTWLLQPDLDFHTSCLQIGEKGQYLLGGWNAGSQEFPAMHAIRDPLMSTCDIGTVITTYQDYDPAIINQLINEFDGGQVKGGKLDLVDIFVNRIVDCQSTSSTSAEYQTMPLKVYPNPTSDVVTIDLSEQLSGVLTWYRFDGSIVRQHQLDANAGPLSFDISSLPAGTYLVELRTADQRWAATVLRSGTGR